MRKDTSVCYRHAQIGTAKRSNVGVEERTMEESASKRKEGKAETDDA